MKKQKIQLPTIKDLASALRDIKKYIYLKGDYITITIGADESGYGMQTGDNSYTGVAYGFRYWGVSDLYKRSNCRELARELLEQIIERATY